jgi:hypothetical protein
MLVCNGILDDGLDQKEPYANVVQYVGLVTSCIGTAFYNTLPRQRQKEQDDEVQNFNRY